MLLLVLKKIEKLGGGGGLTNEIVLCRFRSLPSGALSFSHLEEKRLHLWSVRVDREEEEGFVDEGDPWVWPRRPPGLSFRHVTAVKVDSGQEGAPVVWRTVSNMYHREAVRAGWISNPPLPPRLSSGLPSACRAPGHAAAYDEALFSSYGDSYASMGGHVHTRCWSP